MSDGVLPSTNVLTGDGWKMARKLVVGDCVYDAEGAKVEVTSVSNNSCIMFPVYVLSTKHGRKIILGFDQIFSVIKNGNKVLASARTILDSLGGIGINKWSVVVEPLSVLIAFNDSKADQKPMDVVYSDGIVGLHEHTTSPVCSFSTDSKDGIVLVGTGMFPMYFGGSN